MRLPCGGRAQGIRANAGTTLKMFDGSVTNLTARDNANATIHGGEVNGLFIGGNANLTINDGHISDLSYRHIVNPTLTIRGGTVSSASIGYDFGDYKGGTVNISGGSIRAYVVHAHDLRITGGTFTQSSGSISTNGYGLIQNTATNSSLRSFDGGTLDIYNSTGLGLGAVNSTTNFYSGEINGPINLFPNSDLFIAGGTVNATDVQILSLSENSGTSRMTISGGTVSFLRHFSVQGSQAFSLTLTDGVLRADRITGSNLQFEMTGGRLETSSSYQPSTASFLNIRLVL